jgi:hypothetical protein
VGRLRRGRGWVRVRREWLEAHLADWQARLEQARARSPLVDTAVGAAMGAPTTGRYATT